MYNDNPIVYPPPEEPDCDNCPFHGWEPGMPKKCRECMAMEAGDERYHREIEDEIYDRMREDGL